MKENKAFDKNIQDKLSEVHPDKHCDWDVFSKLLELSEVDATLSQDGINDESLDQSIQKKLNNHAESYQPSHWELLKKSLEAEAYIKRRLLITKAMEFSILFLVLFTYQTLFDPIGIWMQEPILMASNSIKLQTPNHKVINQTSKVNTLNAGITDLKSEGESQYYGIGSEMLPSKPIAPISNNGFDEQLSSVLSLEANATHPTNEHISTIGSDFVAFAASSSHSDNTSFVEEVENLSITNISTLEPTLVSLASRQLTYDSPVVFRFSHQDRNAKYNGTYISAFAGIDNNIIDTPQDPIFANILDHTSYATGYSTGIGILERKGRWDFGLGLYYATQAYNPRGVTEVNRPDKFTQFKATTLDFIRYDLAGLTTYAQYRLFQRSHWSIFSQAGLGLHMIMASNYTFTEKIADTSFRSFEVAGRADLDSSLNLSKKSYEEGLVEGGSIFDNSYMVANIGFGIERNLTHNVSIFGSAGYRHHLFTAAVGPNEDKIHSFSGQIGVRMGI